MYVWCDVMWMWCVSLWLHVSLWIIATITTTSTKWLSLVWCCLSVFLFFLPAVAFMRFTQKPNKLKWNTRMLAESQICKKKRYNKKKYEEGDTELNETFDSGVMVCVWCLYECEWVSLLHVTSARWWKKPADWNRTSRHYFYLKFTLPGIGIFHSTLLYWALVFSIFHLILPSEQWNIYQVKMKNVDPGIKIM